MAVSDAIQGFAGTFTFADFSAAVTGIKTISMNVSREVFDVTVFSTGAGTTAASQIGGGANGSAAMVFQGSKLIDPGTLDLSLYFVPDATPPFDVITPSEFEIKWADGSEWTGKAVIASMSVSTTTNELIMADVQLKLSGPITITPAA